MAKTDSPLKSLFSTCIVEFASWILGVPVDSATPARTEQTAIPEPIYADQLFYVTLKDKRAILIEFQGRSSRPPMRWRMLDYIARILKEHPSIILHSVVFYVEEGAGRNDNGHHEVLGLFEQPVVRWQYQIIRLWEMEAEELLRLGQPALLALVGLTRITQPEKTLPQVVERMKGIEDLDLRERLFTAMLTLISQEEVATMIENLIEDEEDLVFNTPFVRRIRAEGHREGVLLGREEGREEGVRVGREEGREEGVRVGREEGMLLGREEGRRFALRQYILDALVLRFDPSASIYRKIERELANLHDTQALETLFQSVIQSEDVAGFQAALNENTGSIAQE